MSLFLKDYIQNLVENGSLLSEKSKILFSLVNDIRSGSRNDLDLKYSHIFINSITCLHLPNFRSHAALVSEKSNVFHFFDRKA